MRATITLNIFFAICTFCIVSYYLFSSPVNSTHSKTITTHISLNDTLSSVSDELKSKEVIRSKFFLKSFVFLFNPSLKISQGDYLFKRSSPVFTIAWQLAKGEHKIDLIRVTLREGLTNEEMADILADKLSGFRRDLFLEETKGKQGYLFPDTYFFFPMDTTSDIVNVLSDNFDNQIKKVLGIDKDILDTIRMASIIEKEAAGNDDAYLISGILWKRIRIGIPLQVDAAMSTYKTKGLPSDPISNPGLVSIKAALNPTSSSYLYYIHDKDGIVHFANSFEEHKRNISWYLK